jgi:uncharacterized protein (TIGR02246 family)
MMRAIFVLLFLVTATPCLAQSAADRAQVQALPDRFSRAWALHDGHELAKMMSPDVDFVNVGAIWLRGEDFATYHDRILKGRFKSSTNVPLATDARFLRPDLAIVRWSWRIEGETAADGSPQPTRYGLMTMVAEKRNGSWLVTNAQNTNAGPRRSEADDLKAPIIVPRNP